MPKKRKSPTENVVAALESDLNGKNQYGNIASSSRGYLNTFVTKANIDRALTIWECLIREFRKRGYELQVNDLDTQVIVLGQNIKVSVRERHKRTLVRDGKYPEYDLIPTGKLSFRFGERWKLKEKVDDKTLVEFKIPEIVSALEKFAKDENEFYESIRVQHAARIEREHIEQERRKQQENELNRFKALLQEAKRFQECQMLREYVDHLKAQLQDSDESERQRINELTAWAHAKIQWFDPSINAIDETMTEVYKCSLELKEK